MQPQARRIKFVKQSEEPTQEPIQSPSIKRKANCGDAYLQIAFPNGRPVTGISRPSSMEKCDTCGNQVIQTADARAAHASSLVHQLAMGASVRAPAAIDRKSVGFQIMEKHGYDPDRFKGLGVDGEGMKRPIQVKERRVGAALGSKNENEKPRPKREEAAKVVKKTKGQKKAERREEEQRQVSKHGIWYDELFGKCTRLLGRQRMLHAPHQS